MAEAAKKVVVIGAGPGGYVAAIRLAQLGQSVTVVERDAVGGVCLNWGCIPSKSLIYAASLVDKLRHGDDIGILADNIRVDMGKLQAWKAATVKKLTGGIAQLFKNHGIQLVQGEAVFKDAKTLAVTRDGKTETLTGDAFLVATGSSIAALPHLAFDHEVIIDSTDALALDKLPEHLVLVGGGVIGLELGVMYAKLGAKVTVVELLPQLLPGVDSELADALRRSLKRRGVEILLESKVTTANIAGGRATLTVETPKGEKTIDADKVLVAVGRKPNTQALGLDKAGVKLDARGFVTVDAQLKTSVPGIYAIGDITGGALLAHKASKEGLVVADVIAGGDAILDYRALPAAIFTDPEIATVGLTEAQAAEAGLSIRIGKFPFAASGRALSMDHSEGFVKIIADAQTDDLLGVHIIGPEAADLIAEAALAIELGASAEDLALTIHTHPTLPETLMEAAEAVHQQAIHIYQPPAKAPKPTPVA